jgi:hypothetical protein
MRPICRRSCGQYITDGPGWTDHQTIIENPPNPLALLLSRFADTSLTPLHEPGAMRVYFH